MQDLNDKITGGVLTAAEWNEVPSEIQNVIEKSGIALSGGDLDQLGKAIANYVGGGDFYTDSGAADAYVLATVGSKQSPSAYVNGMRIRFIAGNSNTGASTVNVASLGVKSLKKIDGSNLTSGDITSGLRYEFQYDGTDFIASDRVFDKGDLFKYIPLSLHAGINDDSNATDLVPYWDLALTSLAAAAADGKYRTNLLAVSGFYKFVTGLTMPQYLDFSGEGRWNTRLVFALTAAGTAINMEGTTGARMWSTLRRMRIDGKNCIDANVTGISVDWIQDQLPLLDEVTIFGGYQTLGANTGFKNGLVFKEDGSNWIASFEGVGIEGCHGDGMVIDTLASGSSNIINFNNGRVENCRERLVYIIGPNNNTTSQQINFNGYTFEGASLGNTGIQSAVHIQGVKATLNNCYFEGNATPNWVDYELYVPSGDVGLVNAQFHYCQRAIYIGAGRLTISGDTKINSVVVGIVIATDGVLKIRGDIEFLNVGNPIGFNDGTGEIDWVRENQINKTANYSISTGDIGSSFNNNGAKQNITLTMAYCPSGSTFNFSNGLTSILNSTYKWTASGSGTNEYYLELVGGGDPGFSQPTKLYEFATSRTEGTAGSLAATEWDYADNDSLGYSTIYYRNNGGTDPDSGTDDTLYATYTITLTPTNDQRLPLPATTPSDSIVTDGVPGTSMKMRNFAANFWLSEAENGTWI